MKMIKGKTKRILLIVGGVVVGTPIVLLLLFWGLMLFGSWYNPNFME